ncbi:hypothetical protein D9V96_015220 [Zobellia laminariae]|uniref:hypothetical protein n=1 Tax=Zobellia laminariae TaxID=248906 RepID=UPI0012D8B8BD|nr:hypothetical protein [Zobellia laminariae]MUH41249.1 hypothetical protein [Zobellia laminariae]WKX76667.1 hypothetical protein Q5W13_00345 [Zobellia laminariae]
MNDFNYKYTIISKNTRETLFANISDLNSAGSLINDDFFEYIATEAQMRRLGECTLQNEDYICIVKLSNVKSVA